jgi:hypothetical protein
MANLTLNAKVSASQNDVSAKAEPKLSNRSTVKYDYVTVKDLSDPMIYRIAISIALIRSLCIS